MNNLRIIESKQNFVNVYETDKGEKVVNGRELWEVLGSKQDFSTWIKKRLNECDGVENKDYIRFHKKMEANNATLIEYIIKLDTAKEMAMLERNQKGKEVRRYFIEVEEKFKNFLSTQPKTPMQILELEFQVIKEVDKKVEDVKQDLEEFKLEMPVLALDIDKITKAKNKIAVSILGGKESEAYKDVNLRSTLYRDIERELRRQFNIHTHKELKRCEVDKAVDLIKAYNPPLYLKEEIANKNKQIALFQQ